MVQIYVTTFIVTTPNAKFLLIYHDQGVFLMSMRRYI